jgi:retron-type reverse transcriptase
MRRRCHISYQDIISLDNLLLAWQEFVAGKRGRADVQIFHRNLMDNVIDLHRGLVNKTYQHGPYQAFNISDPKPRNIHKATVRDRLVHRAVYRQLYPFFDKRFIHDSYSCRNNKGTHRALDRFRFFARKISKNNTKACWVLKCDIRKFFASIDHNILFHILNKSIADKEIMSLLNEIIGSFSSSYSDLFNKRGLPLGNLTSQLLVNIYMNEFDQYVKHALKVKCYIRYADDFVFMSHDREQLENILRYIAVYLDKHLRLKLHPRKVSISTVTSGVDFLGWIHFPNYRQIRTATKRKMLRNLERDSRPEVLASYRGLLSHGDAYNLWQDIEKNLK